MGDVQPCPKCGHDNRCSFEVSEELRFTCSQCNEEYAVMHD